jgi:lysophospholipase L1-like esterase
LPETKVVLISPKPSVARWNLKNEYEKLNRQLEKLAKKHAWLNLPTYGAPWLMKTARFYRCFLDDNLHMNKKGYDIWGEVIGEFLVE